MARSRLETSIFATILVTPMMVATAYIAFTPTPAPIVLREVVREPAAPTPDETTTVEPTITTPTPDETTTVEPTITAPTPDEVPIQSVHTPEVVRPAGAGMLVYDGQPVLATAPDGAWAKGPLRNIPIEWGVAVSRAVDPTRLPADLAALTDTRVVLYGADGRSCLAETDPALLRIYGRQDGDLVHPAGDDGVATPTELLAARQQVFAEAQLLLARLRPPTADAPRGPRCDGLWARRADLPAPAVFVAQDLDETTRAQVRAQIGAQPAVLALAAEYRTYLEGTVDYTVPPPAWPIFMADTSQATRWDEVGGTRSFVNVVVGDGGQACSDTFTGRAAVLFAREGGELVPQADPGFVHPLALMDLERDGHLEAVTDHGRALESRGPAGTAQAFEFPDFGCPC